MDHRFEHSEVGANETLYEGNAGGNFAIESSSVGLETIIAGGLEDLELQELD